MKHSIKLLALLFLITFISCSKTYKEESYAVAEMSDFSEAKPETGRTTEINENNTDIERKIIKKGYINFETTDATKTRQIITDIVTANNGYISEDNISTYDDNVNYTIAIRVPAKNFDTLLSGVSASAKKIDHMSIEAMDVTEEFIDIQTRIKTKKELEERYKQLLGKANKVDEILNIEREIGTLRTEIESIEGRYNYLKDRVAFSTLNVTFYEKAVSSFGFGSKFVKAIKSGWNNMLWFFIGLINVWPFIIIVVGLIFFIRYWRRKKKNK